MTINLYVNQSENNALTKTLGSAESARVSTIKRPSSIVDPVLILVFSESITEKNYIYIPEFKRYYFIKDITCLRGAENGKYLWQITCHVDVLMSFKESILQQNVVVGRQEFNFNSLLTDSYLPVTAAPIITTQEFPQGFSGDKELNIVLLTNGN